MISMLTGTPSWQDGECVMTCGGVGYGVSVNTKTWTSIDGKEIATLYVHTHVREDEIRLFGFSSLEERHMFLLLLDVQGVGPKTAQVIVNSSAQEIMQAVEQGNISFFTAFPRVGKKVAQKIIIELRSKQKNMSGTDFVQSTPSQLEIVDALQSLGYSSQDISRAIQSVAVQSMPLEEAIRACLGVLRK